jgi:hypothetical protein
MNDRHRTSPASATRQSWPVLHRLPARRAALLIDREFTDEEYEQIRRGFIPESMEDKWFMFIEENTLYIHRSWTGNCIYQLQFLREDTKYAIREAYVNRDETQYAGSSDDYDAKLLLFLIDHLLLKKRSALPMDVNMPAGIFMELHHHHMLGAGQRADAGPINVTLGGALRWLWRWLVWLTRR